MHKPPVSPHLQVYRLPLTAIFSITHRLTSVVLSIGVSLLIVTLVIASSDKTSYEMIRGTLASWWGQSLLILWTAALYFHFCHGIRHLLWDIIIGYSKAAGRLANILTIVSTIALTAATWLVATTV